MTTFEIGKQLVSFCKKGKNLDALVTLYSREIVSIEPRSCQGLDAEMHGIDAIFDKNLRWIETQQVNSSSIEGPFVNGNRFSVCFKYDVTHREDGKRTKMAEIGVYTVDNDKIVKEEFFSTTC